MREEALGFARVAGEYERGRPEYPADIVAWVVETAGVTAGDTVVDLAAGTGKFTRCLQVALSERLGDATPTIIAVEPVAEMRKLIAGGESLTVVDGTAESIGLPNASAALMAVAQAFHWFSTQDAVEEIARVIQPGGHLALVWNRRDARQPLQRELSRIMAPYRQETPTHESGEWRRVLDVSPRFTAAGECGVEHTQSLSRAGLVDRVGSTSFIANLADDVRASVLAEVEALADHEPLSARYICDSYLFQRV